MDNSNSFGRTGWKVSPIGFGGYRIHDRIPEHREALKLALTSGCNLIDTSPSYNNGASELLVGQVLSELFQTKERTREQVIVVTQIGTIQDDTLAIAQRRIAEGSPYPEVVETSEDCWHCISPEFLADEISRSLHRLGLQKIDVLLLQAGNNHPEYYRRIRKAFVYLETQVMEGRIGFYGISSNTCTPELETTLKTTLKIAQTIQKDHHYAVIQFPLNLLESSAVKTILKIAQSEGFATLIQRPLNALSHQRLVRLADISGKTVEQATQSLQYALNETMKLEAEYPGKIPFRQFAWGHLIHHHFNTLAHLETWKSVLENQARPSLRYLEQDHDQKWVTHYLTSMEGLFTAMTEYVQSIARSDSLKMKERLREAVPELAQTTFSSQVISVYRSIPGISCILVGMRTPAYVKDTLKLAPLISSSSALRALEFFQKPVR